MNGVRHFLDLDRFSAVTVRRILDHARALKRGEVQSRVMEGRTLAMIFDKPSTRTRVSFEVAAQQLGGHAVVLSPRDTQLGRGETIADTARVLSRYVHAVTIRTDAHTRLLEFADHASVPVINALTDRSHPCQIVADLQTFEEHRGPVGGRVIAWVGDFNNVARSWAHAAGLFRFVLRVACPPELSPEPELVAWVREKGGSLRVFTDPREAVRGADAVVTDVWVSMSDAEGARKRELLESYRVDAELMALAAPGAIFMHCLPAHRGEEVTAEVIDGPQSVVFDEAENRLHAQKAILCWCLGELPE